MPFGLKNPFSKPAAPDAVAMSDGGITAEDDWETPVTRVADGTPGPARAAHEAAHTVQQRDSSGVAAAIDEPGSPLDSPEVVSPRDPASGLATGRTFTVDAQGPTVDVTSPRDPDDDGDGFDDAVSSDDAGSGLAAGRRMHKPPIRALADETTGPRSSTTKSPRHAMHPRAWLPAAWLPLTSMATALRTSLRHRQRGSRRWRNGSTTQSVSRRPPMTIPTAQPKVLPTSQPAPGRPPRWTGPSPPPTR